MYAFLNDHPLTAHLATVREDGRPHVAPVWIAVDGADMIFTTWAAIIGGRYMGADQADDYGARNAVEGEWLCRMHPTQVSGIIAISE